MRVGAPENDSLEAVMQSQQEGFEAQQELEAQAAAEAAQRREDKLAAESAKLKDPPPELGAPEN